MMGDHLRVDQSLSLLNRSPTYSVVQLHILQSFILLGVRYAPLGRLWVNAAASKCFVAMFEHRLSLVFLSGMEFYPLGYLNDQIPLQTTGIERSI